jgi:hypothetical protein
MDSARHVIRCDSNPRLLHCVVSYDVASTVHQSLPATANPVTGASAAAPLVAGYLEPRSNFDKHTPPHARDWKTLLATSRTPSNSRKYGFKCVG